MKVVINVFSVHNFDNHDTKFFYVVDSEMHILIICYNMNMNKATL